MNEKMGIGEFIETWLKRERMTVDSEFDISDLVQIVNDWDVLTVQHQPPLYEEVDCPECGDKAVYTLAEVQPPWPIVKYICSCGYQYALMYGYEQDEYGNSNGDLRKLSGECQKCKKEIITDCNCTNGKIRKPIYYTPEAYESWMHNHGQPEFKLGDSDRVWMRYNGEWESISWGDPELFHNDISLLVHLIGQPKPPVEGVKNEHA